MHLTIFGHPLVDRLQIPYLNKKTWSQKRLDIFNANCNFNFSGVTWSYINPAENLVLLLILVGLIIAIASATQDITVDALRIEQIGDMMKKKRWLLEQRLPLLDGGVDIN